MPKRRSLESAGISDAQYLQIMERVAEQNYQDWGLPSSDAALVQALNDNTYDYRGYYNKYPNSRANASTHWTDEFKTVYHPTFSDESRYSGKKSQYNPKGIRGGHWYGDVFVPSIPQLMERRGLKNGGYLTRLRNKLKSDIETANNAVSKHKRVPSSPKPVTTGGAGYVPPAIDADNVINTLSNLWNYSKTYIKNKFAGTGEGEVIDLSKKKVSRIKSDTNNVTSILINDFVERNNNMVRRKKDFINTTDTLLGDKKIPLSKISTFYGVEDGKLKAGPIDIFNDTTTIVPNRAKNIGKVKEYHPAKPQTKEYKEAVKKAIKEYNAQHGYEPSFLQRIFNTGFPFISDPHPWGVLSHNVGRKRAREIKNELAKKYEHLGSGKLAYVVTENNDTIRGYKLNASPKTLFADENGNAVFVAQPGQHLKELNSYLQKHPMYPIMVDNGRYAAYQTTMPNAEIYGGLNRPDNMFILGTIGRDKQRNGGSIYIQPSKRGTFTAAASKHGMGVQEFASRVLRNKDSYSPAMVKKANFARNASKWNH